MPGKYFESEIILKIVTDLLKPRFLYSLHETQFRDITEWFFNPATINRFSRMIRFEWSFFCETGAEESLALYILAAIWCTGRAEQILAFVDRNRIRELQRLAILNSNLSNVLGRIVSAAINICNGVSDIDFTPDEINNLLASLESTSGGQQAMMAADYSLWVSMRDLKCCLCVHKISLMEILQSFRGHMC